MDIYLVPAGRHRYGLYCEVEDRHQGSEDGTRPGWRAALSRQFHRGLAYLETERRDRLAKAAGFRNLVVHTYEHLDMARIHAAAKTGPADLREFLAALVRIQRPRG